MEPETAELSLEYLRAPTQKRKAESCCALQSFLFRLRWRLRGDALLGARRSAEGFSRINFHIHSRLTI